MWTKTLSGTSVVLLPKLSPLFLSFLSAVCSGCVCASQQPSIHPLGSPYIPVVISHSWLLFPSATPVENTLQTNTHGHGYVYQRPCNSTSFPLISTPLSLDQTCVVWVVVGSIKVQYQSVWFEVLTLVEMSSKYYLQAFVPLKEEITGMQDHLLPQFNTTKKTSILCGQMERLFWMASVLLKQACVLLKGKYFKAVKSSSVTDYGKGNVSLYFVWFHFGSVLWMERCVCILLVAHDLLSVLQCW